jgi:septal ring factor EnvC (AmiA/AmiB activator)
LNISQKGILQIKKKAGLAVFFFAGAFFLIMAGSIYGVVIKEEIKDYSKHLEKTKNDLRQVKEQLSQERQRIQAEKKQERVTTRYIQKLEKEIDVTRKEMDVFSNNIGVLQSGISDMDRRMADKQKVILEKRKIVETILRQQYKNKDREYLSVLFSSRSFSEFIKRYKFVKILSKKNMQQVIEYSAALEQLERDRRALLEYHGELKIMKKEKEDEFKKFKNEKWQKNNYLSGVKKDIQKRKKVIGELEQSAKNLSSFMEQIEISAGLEDASAESAFLNFAGKFPWPVDGGSVLAKFGKFKHPQFGSIVDNRGIHIREKPGAPVYSIFKGVIKYADWFEGYGKMIIVHHGGNYYSIYGHMSKLSVSAGDKVDIKQKIGEIGDTESC